MWGHQVLVTFEAVREINIAQTNFSAPHFPPTVVRWLTAFSPSSGNFSLDKPHHAQSYSARWVWSGCAISDIVFFFKWVKQFKFKEYVICCFLSYEHSHTWFVEMNLKVVSELPILPVFRDAWEQNFLKILPLNIRVIHSHVGQRCHHNPIMHTALMTDWYKSKCIYSNFEANVMSLFPVDQSSLAECCVAKFTLRSWCSWIVVIYITCQILTPNYLLWFNF